MRSAIVQGHAPSIDTNNPSPRPVLRIFLSQGMNFNRWYFNDDTPSWSRKAWRFMLILSVELLVVLIGWLAIS